MKFEWKFGKNTVKLRQNNHSFTGMRKNHPFSNRLYTFDIHFKDPKLSKFEFTENLNR